MLLLCVFVCAFKYTKAFLFGSSSHIPVTTLETIDCEGKCIQQHLVQRCIDKNASDAILCQLFFGESKCVPSSTHHTQTQTHTSVAHTKKNKILSIYYFIAHKFFWDRKRAINAIYRMCLYRKPATTSVYLFKYSTIGLCTTTAHSFFLNLIW